MHSEANVPSRGARACAAPSLHQSRGVPAPIAFACPAWLGVARPRKDRRPLEEPEPFVERSELPLAPPTAALRFLTCSDDTRRRGVGDERSTGTVAVADGRP